ncbi:MAG: Fe-S cluster assembly protein SufD [Acidobacteriota bacterium]
MSHTSGAVRAGGTKLKEAMTPILAKEKDSFLSAIEELKKARTGLDPAWLERLRVEAGSRVEVLDFPTTRDEEWRYTNIAPLLKLPLQHSLDLDLNGMTAETIEPFAFSETRTSLLVFVNGRFVPEHSNLAEMPEGVFAGSLTQLPLDQENILRNHLAVYANYRDDALIALNTAMIADGAVIYIPDGVAVERPIHVLFVATATKRNNVAYPRLLVVAGRGAAATIIESYVSPEESVHFTNAVTEVHVGERARLDHYRLQEESSGAFHIGTTVVFQEGASFYGSCAISLGSRLARHTLDLALNGQRSESVINGLYVVSDGQHADSHTTIDHMQPNCVSKQLYKGILDGNGRAVFNGKILVREGALHTDSRQLNKNLLLSDEATVDTKPQLEIFADDVKCAHGATVGQLEDEELFYLASRGIDLERARALLTYGFAEDVISKIPLESVRTQLDRIVLDKLHQNLEVQ